MFTGIIEVLGKVEHVSVNGSNKTFSISSPISHSFTPDQSVSHDGVCLTVETIQDNQHTVTAIQETLLKTNLDKLKVGDFINMERCLTLQSRLDGHIVQGHVDTTGVCSVIEDKGGSVEFTFTFPENFSRLIIEKGSIAVNGISLTAFNVTRNSFTVAIIPYTLAHTNIQYLKKGDPINLEFDMVGKYVIRDIDLKAK